MPRAAAVPQDESFACEGSLCEERHAAHALTHADGHRTEAKVAVPCTLMPKACGHSAVTCEVPLQVRGLNGHICHQAKSKSSPVQSGQVGSEPQRG